jgi:hypothetical protein
MFDDISSMFYSWNIEPYFRLNFIEPSFKLSLGIGINMSRFWPYCMHPKSYWFALKGLKPKIYGTLPPFECSIVKMARFDTVVKQFAIKLMNTVPTIEQSGM